MLAIRTVDRSRCGVTTADLRQSQLRHPLAIRSEQPAHRASAAGVILDQFGQALPRTDDPAFQAPIDPMGDIDKARGGARVIQRQIPMSVISTDWTVDSVRGALNGLVQGNFIASSQLVDAITGDDRVQATLGSRTGGLFGRPVKFKQANDSAAAKEVCEAWQADWPRIGTEAVLRETQIWTVMQGWAFGAMTWDTTGERWIPRLQPWHPRFSLYIPQLFKYYVSTQDGFVNIAPGAGQWFLHAPHGEYRGWMRGAVRAVAQPWLIRNFAYRDWARYSERHGMPMIKAFTPAAGDAKQREQFVGALNNIGQETVIMLPQGVDESFSYDVTVLEATDQAWQSFPGLIDRCDMSIVLAILFQNLTTEVKEGSFAAARVHGDVRQSALASDNSGLRLTIRDQIARPYAGFNFGDPELAPWTEWDVDPVEDRDGETKIFLSFCQGLQALKLAGFDVEPKCIPVLAWNMCGLKLGAIALEKSVAVVAAAPKGSAPVKDGK